jgi:hypothetical protein
VDQGGGESESEGEISWSAEGDNVLVAEYFHSFVLGRIIALSNVDLHFSRCRRAVGALVNESYVVLVSAQLL